jgi:uncharacterized protein YndB with AHSA1/START domain
MTPGPFAGLVSDELGQAIAREDGRFDIVFERRLKKPVEKVWAALTIPERVADWFTEVEIDLRLGGLYRIHFRDMDYVVDGQITELDPLQRFTHTWPDVEDPRYADAYVRYELWPDGDGTRLRLTQTALPRKYLGAIAGWHVFLEALPGACEGIRTPWTMERETEMGARYADLLAEHPQPTGA